jgi:hypothetical protein
VKRVTQVNTSKEIKTYTFLTAVQRVIENRSKKFFQVISNREIVAQINAQL